MKIFSTKIRYLLIVTAIITVGGVLVGSVYLDSAAFRNMVLVRVNSALDGRLMVGGHRLSIVSGRLVMTGLRLEGADGQRVAEAGRLEIRIALSALLDRTIHVSRLDLEKLRLMLAFDDQDRLQGVGLRNTAGTGGGSGQTSGPWRMIVDDCRLQGGELVFRRPARGWSGRAQNIQLGAALDLARRQGRVQVSGGPLVWQAGDLARTLPTLMVAVQYNGVGPSKVTIKTEQSSLEALGRLNLEGGVPELDVTADLDLAIEEVRPWIPADIRLEGRVAARVAARGPVDDPDVDMHLNMSRGNLAGIDVAPLDADLNLRNGKVSVADLEARGRWGTLNAGGVVDLAGKRIEKSRATLTSANLADLGAALGVELPSGSGRVKLSGQGDWTHPAARAEVLADDLKWRQYQFGRLLAGADLDVSGVVTLSQLVLENQGSLVEGRGRIVLQQADGRWRADPGLDLALEVENLDPADFGLDLPARGLIKATLKIGGSVRHLQGRAALADSTLRWKDLAFDLGGAARWEDGRLTVSDLRLSRDQAAIGLRGSLELRDPRSGQWLDAPAMEARLSSQGVQLQDFRPDFTGALTLEAQVKGTTADLSGSFQLTASDLELAGQPLAAAIVKGRLAQRVVHLETLDVTVADGQKIRGSGWCGFDRHFQLALDSAGIDLGLIPALQRAYPVEGLLGLSMKGQGTLQKPRVTAVMTVRQPRLNGQPWDDFHLQARLQEREVDLEADLNFKLKARGRLDSGDFNLTAGLDDADLSLYLAMAGGAQWGGRLSGRIQAAGNWHRPRNIRADLDISQAHLRYQDVDLLSCQRLRARLQDGKIDLPASRLELMQDGFVNLSAGGDLRRDLRLAADGRLPLAALAPFSDLLDGARGALAFQARVDGPLDGLQWQADATLAEVALEIPGLNQAVQGLNGRVQLNPSELSVEQVAGSMGGGRFSLAGRVALKDLKPAGGRLVLKAQSLPLQWPDTMDVVVNGEVTLESAGNKAAVQTRAAK